MTVSAGTERRRANGKIKWMRAATYGAAHRDGAAPVLIAKSCQGCDELLMPSGFSKSKAKTDGLQVACKSCNSAWGKAHPEQRRDTWRRYRRATYMKDKYGLTIEEYWAMYDAQGQRCKICRVHGDDAGQHTVQQLPLHVDHDHETGAVRGLLCRQCNMMLGSGRDDPAFLHAGADYIEAHRMMAEVADIRG